MARTTFDEFSRATQERALVRQKHHCASCGAQIAYLGEACRSGHPYGEGAQAHHIRHVKLGGTNALVNCVILCWSCHYSAHEGGRYRTGSVVGRKGDFPHFNG